MLDTRTRARFAVGQVVSEAADLWPLSGPAGATVFDRDPPTLQLVSRERDIPTLEYPSPIFYELSQGQTRSARGTSLLTFTDKMGCPSFSLSAGPPVEGGSCAAAAHGAKGGLRRPGAQYICDTCYSLEGRYVMDNVALAQASRAWWINQQIASDPTGDGLARSLLSAIIDFARHSTLEGLRGGMSVRMILELGTWRRGAVMVPGRNPVSGKSLLIHAVSTEFPAGLPWRDSSEALSSLRPSDDDVCGFFRIHDSGDLTIPGGPKRWSAYLSAWTSIARALPRVIFWMPTRAWAFPAMVRQLQAATASAPNLVIRPSALHVGDPAPTIPGLASGSTVATKTAPRTFTTPGDKTWLCPVRAKYDWDPERAPARTRADGRLGAWVAPLSCQDARCRACWLAPATAVAYGEKS